MEHTPPAFFNRGPAPVVRLTFFAIASLALIILDARFRYTEGLRGALALATQPFQIAAAAPAAALRRATDFFTSQSQLSTENTELRTKLAEAKLAAQRLEAAAAEGARLKALMGAAERLPASTTPPKSSIADATRSRVESRSTRERAMACGQGAPWSTSPASSAR
jgi:rod shape-determining protein MreC